jgi:hypothetical protein
MKRRMRNTGQVMPVLLTLTVLLASCWGGSSTSPHTHVDHSGNGGLSGPPPVSQ